MKILLPIARPPWTSLGKQLESLIRKALYDFQMLEGGGEALAIALSGGKDSLSLLFLLQAILGRGFPKLSLQALHVDGEFSCGSGVSLPFLKGICKELGVNFIQLTSQQKQEGLECYSCSRERRSLLFRKAKEVGAKIIAFGHHRDDSIQTFLMNLLHKGEAEGNIPVVEMRDYGVRIIRPLIYVPEKLLYEFSKKYGFNRVSCLCPVGQNSQRKKTEQLIQEMEKLYPHARGNLFLATLKP